MHDDPRPEIAELLPDAVWVLDRERRITYANQRAAELLERPVAEMLGRIAGTLRAPAALRDRWHALAAQAIATGTPQAFDYAWDRGDGMRWYEARIVPLAGDDPSRYLLCIMRDVHQRHAYDTSLRESEERYRRLVEISPDAVFVHRQGILAFVNQAAVRLLGAETPEQLVGVDARSLVHPDDRQVVLERLRRLQLADEPAPFIEERLRRLDGSYVHVEVASVPCTWQGERCVIGIARDITERKRTAEQLGQRQARLAHAQKLEAIGQLAGGIAHDFNNLLTIILAQCEFLADGMPEEGPLRRDLLVLRGAAERGAQLTSQLLSFARRQVILAQPVELGDALTRFAEVLRRLVGPEIEVQVRAAPDLPPALVDPGHLEQVVLNLALNARDAMPAGGTLTLGTAPVQGDARLVQFFVADTGAGMTPEVKERLFEPFFTTKPVGKGTGLGLASAFGIVQQSGGRIEVDSTLGQGTRVSVLLPRSSAPAPLEAPAKAPRAAADRRRATILVAEDDESVRGIAVRTLEAAGFSVLAADSGQAALELARRHGDIELLLTDLRMPHLSGEELAQRLRASLPELPVIYCSGYGEEVEAGIAGASFLAKPYVPAELLARVDAALASRRP